MEPQIKVIKELCLLVLSHSGLAAAELLSLTVTGHVKLHSGEVQYITADLGGCLVEEQDPMSGSQQTTAPAASVPKCEDPVKQHAHHQLNQNLGKEPQHDRSPAAGSTDPTPGNPAHAAAQLAAAAAAGCGDSNGDGKSSSATHPPAAAAAAAAAAAVTTPVQPRTFKRKVVQLAGRDHPPHRNAKRTQHHCQVPAEVSAEYEIGDAVAAAVAAPVLADNTGLDVSALASSKYGTADSQQTSRTTAEAAVASVEEAAAMSAHGPVKVEQNSNRPQVYQHTLKQRKPRDHKSGATTATPATEKATWRAAEATSSAAAARHQTRNTAATYKCAFKTLLETKPRGKGTPERYLCYIQTPHMTNFRFIKVATDAVCGTIEAECDRATCWEDVHQVLRQYCTPEMCQKLAQLHAEAVE